MKNSLDFKIVDEYLKLALREDISNLDISTCGIIEEEIIGEVSLICKEDGVLSGIEVFKRVFKLLGKVEFKEFFKDGDKIEKGNLICIIKASCRNLLSGERVALNYLQRMSGISTLTKEYIEKMDKNSKTKLLDTRKTTPNMRIFEKYAVKVGGGKNHRFNLSDGVMLKDNHINGAKGIKNAVKLARDFVDITKKIEVEVENISMVREALEAGADIIMLDNMSIEEMREGIEIISNKALVEISGNVNLNTINKLSKLNADFISCGALTHSAKILDFSLKNLKIV